MPFLQPGLRSLETPGPIVPLLEDIADKSSALREVSTTRFNKYWAAEPFDFPNSYIDIPLRVMKSDPISTRSEVQNIAFMQRYLKNF
jgi:hypothetical protein